MRWKKSLLLAGILLFFGATQSWAAPPTMEDYWNGRAEWKLSHTLTRGVMGWEYGYAGGAQLRVVGGVWYLFGNKYYWGQKCGGNWSNMDQVGVVVRKSTDKGATWSNPVEIIPPTSGTEWDCMSVDGSYYFDARINKWHYLFQCLKGTGGWNLCHAQSSAADPTEAIQGAFTQIVHSNPVVPASSLWSQICDQPSDHCSSIVGGTQLVYDEGTPDIFHFDGTHFWVSFHGYKDPYGFRGLGKTATFAPGSWIVNDPGQGVPADALLDLHDTQGWRESWIGGNSVGIGASRTLQEGGYYYQMAEAMDINLGCINGQNWNIGLFRTNNLASTQWEQFPGGNPVLYSSQWPEASRGGKSPPCTPGYATLFRDDQTGEIYFHFTRLSLENIPYDGIFIYKLTNTGNVLKNANFWTCRAEPEWQRFNGSTQTTNYISYRYPDKSTDSNCYLAMNCGGASCQPGQSVYQDVAANTLVNRTIAFGGKLMSEGGNGSVSLAVHEMDANKSTVLQTHWLQAATTQSYQEFRKTVTLLPNTSVLRFQPYLNTAHNFRMDEMFLRSALEGDHDGDGWITYLDIWKFAQNISVPVGVNIFDFGKIVSNFGQN